MANYLEILKTNLLVDDREIWAQGQIRKTFDLGMLFGAIGGAMSAVKNTRVLSIKGTDLIVSKISKKQPVDIQYFNKNNVGSAQLKTFGANKKLILKNKEGKKIIFLLRAKKPVANQIVEIFQ